MKSTRGLRGRK